MLAYGAGIIIIINDYIAHEVPKWQDLNSKVVPHHAVRWRNIAIELGLAPSMLDTIAENCGEKSQEYLTAVLEKWLMQDGPMAIWKKLEHAITNVRRAELGLDPLEMDMLIYSYQCIVVRNRAILHAISVSH